MDIKMAGIDHSRASLAYRELFSFTKSAAAAAMRHITSHYPVGGCVLLFTCNRTELWLSGCRELALSPLDLLCRIKGEKTEEYRPYFIEREGEQAAEHLFTLSCGMESKIYGEDQIITQVKDAISYARECGCADSTLEKLFQTAVAAAKRVKTDVRLTAADSSVAEKAAGLLLQRAGDLNGLPCLVIGNGEMGRLMASSLAARGCNVTMTLRQYKAGNAVIPDGCKTIPYSDRVSFLPQVRVVASATTSLHHTLKYSEAAAPLSDGIPRILFDLAVPRDIEPELGNLRNVELYDIDMLGGAEADEAGRPAAELARGILLEYEAEFHNWYYFRSYVPSIQEISGRTADDIEFRLQKQLDRLPLEKGDRETLRNQIEDASRKAVSRLLYGLRETLGQEAWDGCIAGLALSSERKVRP